MRVRQDRPHCKGQRRGRHDHDYRRVSVGVSLDADKLYDAVIARFSSGDFSDLDFEYDTVPCESVDLQQYYDKYCKEMTDAYYDEEKKELVPEVNGYGFDLPYYTQQLAMAKAGEVITIQMEDLVPEVTLEELKRRTLRTFWLPTTARILRTPQERKTSSLPARRLTVRF